MKKNDSITGTVVYIFMLFGTVVFYSPNICGQLYIEPTTGATINLVLIAFACHYFIPANFDRSNKKLWLLLTIQFLCGVLLNLQAFLGLGFLVLLNFMNLFSVKWFGRKMNLVSTQTIQGQYRKRNEPTLTKFEFLQIPLLLLFLYFTLLIDQSSFVIWTLTIPILD